MRHFLHSDHAGRGRTLLAIGLVSALGAAGALASTAPAGATLVPSQYATALHGYGTYVVSQAAGLESAPTAYSGTSCAKTTGTTKSNSIARADLNGGVRVGASTTSQRTLLLSNGDTLARSVTTLASVTIGDNTLGFKITGLKGVSDTRGTRAGKLSAANTFTFTDLSPLGTTQLPPPLNQPADVILKQLASGGPVTIPNLGTISLGGGNRTVSSSNALASTLGLRIRLFGADQAAGGGDDSDVRVASSWSWMSKSAPYGVISGASWGIDGTALGGIVSVGKNPFTPIACQGTGGVIRSHSLAGLDLANQNQLVVDGLRNRNYGKQGTPTNGLTAWTESTVAAINLGGGQLQISGIRALAKVVRNGNGTFHPMYLQQIGSITANGTPQAIPDPGQALEIPNVARIEVPAPVKSVNGVKVTAVRITLLGGSAANTVINLGHAEVSARTR